MGMSYRALSRRYFDRSDLPWTRRGRRFTWSDGKSMVSLDWGRIATHFGLTTTYHDLPHRFR